MATLAEFQTRFPEFAAADPTFVQAKLDEATRQTNVQLWGALSDDGIYLLTAQKLAKSPQGNTGKLVNKDGETVYDEELERLRADVTGGYRVT